MTDDLKHIDGEAVVDSAVDVFGDVSFSAHKNYTVEQLAGGRYVALWSDDNSAIMAHVYGADIDLSGSIDTDGSDDAAAGPTMLSAEGDYPNIAALSEGGFVAAWLNDKVIEYRIIGSNENDGWVLDINMSDIENIGNVEAPSVTALTDGGFVVTWAMATNSASQHPVNPENNIPDISTPNISTPEFNKPDLYLQRFAANGDAVAQIQEIPVPDYDLSPDVTALPDGGYVLVWNNDTYSNAGSNADSNAGPKFTPIPVQRYDEYNTLAFSTVLLVPRSDYYQTPEITGLTSGGFIVSFAASGSDFGTGTKIHMYDNRNVEVDHFNLTGLVGVEGTTVPQVSALWNGGFIVTWGVSGGNSEVSDLGYTKPEIYAQRFDANGQAVDKAPLNISYLNISTADNSQTDPGPDNQDGDSSSNNNSDTAESTADNIDVDIDADRDLQQAYVDVNSWITTEDTFGLKDILHEGPLVNTGKISKAIQDIFVSKADKLGRFFANEEPIRNNSVIYVMALYVDQTGYFQFGPIAGLVFLDLKGDLTLTFEEPLVQAVTLSSAFGELGVSLEILDEELSEVTLTTEASIVLYDGEALQAYFEQLQTNPETLENSEIFLPNGNGETLIKEGSIELVGESPDALNGIVVEEYSVEDRGFINAENGVFYFAEDGVVDSTNQASGSDGPLQIDVSYTISAATSLSSSGTSSPASGSSDAGSVGADAAGSYSIFSYPAPYGSGYSGNTGPGPAQQGNTQNNEDQPLDETVSATAITEITVELVAIQDINYQGVDGEQGEHVDLAFKQGVEINPAGDQVSFYIDEEGNLRGEGPDTTKITAELMRSEDGNRITLKFVDGQSGPQMVGKLELESLLKTVLPKHSDVDFDIKVTVETTFYNDDYNVLGTASNVDSYTISVDAVADRGTIEIADAQDGVQPDVNAHITISVDVSFDDYADGSEDHTVVLNNVPAEWALLSDSLLISGPTADPDYPDLVSYQFDVSDLVDAGNGSASLPIEFDPQNWTPPCGNHSGDQDAGPDHVEGNTGGGSGGNHAEIEVLAIATEANLSGDDYTYGNNVATTVNYFTVNSDECSLFEDENGSANVVELSAGNDTFDDHGPGAEIDLVDGAEGNDTIWTGGGDDILFGAEGNDKLYGEGGDDYLIGGAGDDILRGGSGADGFIFTGDDLGGSDVIRDFRAEQDDTLVLMDLLVDDGSLSTAGDNSELATALESYLEISSDGTNTTIVVDADGSDPGTDVATITLQNVDLTLGGTVSNHDAIQSLLDNDNLVID
ncbi:MAG: type I secretion C-terminal target domain-containing protein [Halopseudomonas aestusnigri]